jgi:hypothetical protein
MSLSSSGEHRKSYQKLGHWLFKSRQVYKSQRGNQHPRFVGCNWLTIYSLYRVFHHLLASRDGKIIRHSFTQGGLSLTVRVNSMITTMSMVLAPLESNAIKTICIVIVR